MLGRRPAPAQGLRSPPGWRRSRSGRWPTVML